MAADVVLRVARSCGQAPHVVAAWPYASALAACLALVRADADADLRGEADDLRRGFHTAYAVNEPRRLEQEARRFDAKLHALCTPRGTPGAGLLVYAEAFGKGAQTVPAPTEG